jgi:hypothetical protein
VIEPLRRIVSHVKSYRVELRARDGNAATVAAAGDRAHAAAHESRAAESPVWFVRTEFVPETSTCFLVFEGGSAAAVAEATPVRKSWHGTHP